MQELKDFDRYFKTGFKEDVEFGANKYPVEFRSVYAGELHLGSSNKIAVGELDFPVEGIYAPACPVDYTIGKTEHFKTFNPSEFELVGFVRIICKEAKPVEWKLAQGTYPTGSDHIFNEVRVDSGTLVISDPLYGTEIEKIIEEHDCIESFTDLIEIADNKETDPPIKFETLLDTGFSVLRRVNGFESLEIDSGFGDGTYKVYAGYDKKGDVCRLVCDFAILSPTNWGRYIITS